MGRRIPDSDLIDELVSVSEAIGRTPRRDDMEEKGQYSSSTYKNRFGSWNEALEAAGFQPNKEWGITQDALIEEVQKVNDSLDTTPRRKDMEYSQYSPQVYTKRFESWECVLQRANIEVDPYEIPIDELQNELVRLSTVVGGSPTEEEMWKQGAYSPAAYQRRFGSWNEALKHVGLPVNARRNIPTHELIEALQELHITLCKTPERDDMTTEGAFSPDVFEDRFRSWNGALEACGIPIDSVRSVSREAALDDLRRVSHIIGTTPSQEDYLRHGTHSVMTPIEKFGSWNAALETAGLTINEEKHISETSLLEDIHRIVDEFGSVPSFREMHSQSVYSPGTYMEHFGSWNNAIEAAGYSIKRHNTVSDAELLKEIDNLANRLGRPPSYSEMDSEGEFSAGTYTAHFGSWYSALDEAGYEHNRMTSIERIGVSILDKLDVEFEPFVDIGPYEADTVLPEYDVVLEFDGDYWHGHPSFESLDEIQQTHKSRDREKDEYLEESGYTVVRIWGSELRDRTSEVRQSLLELLDAGASQSGYLLNPRSSTLEQTSLDNFLAINQ